MNLPAPARSARLRVSADARYTLFINRRWVHHGPARSYPAWQSFDTLDVKDFLIAGRNAICAIVHQFGVPTFQSVYRVGSGFILDGVIQTSEASIPLHTPDGWLARNANAWRQQVARHSLQRGFQEHFDANADPHDWMHRDYQPDIDGGWHPPLATMAIGFEPWLKMEERGVPLLASYREQFAEVIGQFAGESESGFESAENIYQLARQERRERAVITADVSSMLASDDATTAIPPPQPNSFVAFVLDTGCYRTGHFTIDIAEAAGGEIFDILYSEALDESGFPLLVPTDSHSREATADRYRCRPGSQKWETFQFHGMRYIALILRNLTRAISIRHLGVRQVHATVENAGEFACSDARLNEIWQVARRTQLNCLIDAFVDCPWREQAMWWGDARVQSRVSWHAFADVSFLERGIRLMARSQGSDGSLHAHPPADTEAHRLPDFMLTWISSLWDHYFQTGSSKLLRECLPDLHALLEFFATHENSDGLIGGFDGWWVFLDWQDLYKRDYSAVLNLMYLQAMGIAAKVCELLGDEAAARYRARTQSLGRAIEKYFWDSTLNVWRDGFDSKTNRSIEQISQHANALALLLNLKPEHGSHIATEILLKPAQACTSDILTASPFFYAYVLEAILGAGLRSEAIALIRDKWGAMIDAGATTFWELWKVDYQSRCHAWSASPLYHLSEQVLGVMPTAPGWRKIRIAPCVEGLQWAKGVVPSPMGLIHVQWKRRQADHIDVRLGIPAGIDSEFVAPSGTRRSLQAGINEFQA